MATWTQYTYVNGELKYEPKKRSADDMVGLFAQMHFLKQAGDDITVNADTDDEWNITEYKVIRTLKGKKLFYRFVKG